MTFALSAGKLTALWAIATQRIDAMPARERHALLAAGLALLVAAETLVVLPLHSKRVAIVSAATDQLQSEQDAAEQARSALAQAEAQLQAQLVELDRDLAALGVGSSAGQPLGPLLARTLRGQAVQVISLRELGTEALDVAAAAPSTTPSAAAAPADAAVPALYRHRYELSLAGEVPALTAAVHALDVGVRPLRIERVRLASADGAGLAAIVTLAVVGTERSWLSI